jgi:hypothetical protein
MDIIKVISLDPGGTTGWAKGLISDGRMGVISGQFAYNHLQLFDGIRVFRPDHIVCERFDYRKPAKGSEGTELISRELIGVVNLYVQVREEQNTKVELYMQMPAEALGGYWQKDEKLKEDKVFMVGKPHANDAMRHLLQWYQFKEGYQFNKDGFYRLDQADSLPHDHKLVNQYPW